MSSPAIRALAASAAECRGAFLLAGVLLSACGSAGSHQQGIPKTLLQEARPIGVGPRFHPPPSGSPVGRCTDHLGARIAIHLEVFAAGRVVLIPAGIGTRPPLTTLQGRIVHARCYGAITTLDTTGVVLVSNRVRTTLAELFRSWRQPLTRHRLLSFSGGGGQSVRAFVNGRRWSGSPVAIPLRAHAEIVLEVGPYVRPHASYAFPPL